VQEMLSTVIVLVNICPKGKDAPGKNTRRGEESTIRPLGRLRALFILAGKPLSAGEPEIRATDGVLPVGLHDPRD